MHSMNYLKDEEYYIDSMISYHKKMFGLEKILGWDFFHERVRS